jgi:hypothetical protein
MTRSVYLGFFHRLPFRYNRLGDFHVMARFVVMVVSVRMTRLHRLVVSTALARFGVMVVSVHMTRSCLLVVFPSVTR